MLRIDNHVKLNKINSLKFGSKSIHYQAIKKYNQLDNATKNQSYNLLKNKMKAKIIEPYRL